MDSPYDEDQRTYQNTVVRGLYAMGAMQGPSMMVVCLPVDKDGVVDEHQAVFLGTADAMPAIETLMREKASCSPAIFLRTGLKPSCKTARVIISSNILV